MLFLATARVITRVQTAGRPDDAIQVVAVGQGLCNDGELAPAQVQSEDRCKGKGADFRGLAASALLLRLWISNGNNKSSQLSARRPQEGRHSGGLAPIKGTRWLSHSKNKTNVALIKLPKIG